MEIAGAILVGFILDSIVGDPNWLPHPIIFIGKLISLLEKNLIKIFPKSPKGKFWAGVFLWIVTVTLCFVIPFSILLGLKAISPWLKIVLESFWCFQIFASKSLEREADKIKKLVEKGDLEGARKALSMVVGRDTAYLSEKEILKAVIETVSENTTDGVISPLFYLAIGGAPLGFLYKGVNTLDSMVGYKNDKYIELGKFSAIADDCFNYIPARITGFTMVLSSFLTGLKGKKAFNIMIRDHKKHASPNGGWTEATTAGALGISLGGDSYYFGKLYKKAILGDDLKEVETKDVEKTCKLMWVTSIFLIFISILIRLGLENFL